MRLFPICDKYKSVQGKGKHGGEWVLVIIGSRYFQQFVDSPKLQYSSLRDVCLAQYFTNKILPNPHNIPAEMEGFNAMQKK